MNKKFWLLIFIGVIGLIGATFLFLKSKGNQQEETKIILFYGIGCPHCARVEEFIEVNKVEEKVEFERREVYFNKKNAKLLLEKANICGLPKEQIGVPFLWDGSKCFAGDQDIINFFKEKINL